MMIKEIQEIIFQENIITPHQKNDAELIILLDNGSVINYNRIQKEKKELFTITAPKNVNFSDGGFDEKSHCSIYSLDDIIVISNDWKTHAFIHYPGRYTIRIQREDYHANISKFPIALFKNTENIPHLIYGNAWNRVDILNLENCQNLTADKSLIELDAEERHEKYVNPEQYGYHIWPKPFDYFYANLQMSPDNKHFLSRGWNWGSSDGFYVFNVEDFIQNKRIKPQTVGYWEHESRSACWISNDEILVCCNSIFEEFDDADENNPIEIVRYRLINEKFEQIKRTKVPELTDTNWEFYYHSSKKAVISYPKGKEGLHIFDLEGNTIFKNNKYKIESFNLENMTFVTLENNHLHLFKIDIL